MPLQTSAATSEPTRLHGNPSLGVCHRVLQRVALLQFAKCSRPSLLKASRVAFFYFKNRHPVKATPEAPLECGGASGGGGAYAAKQNRDFLLSHFQTGRDGSRLTIVCAACSWFLQSESRARSPDKGPANCSKPHTPDGLRTYG